MGGTNVADENMQKIAFNPAPWADDVVNAYSQIKAMTDTRRRKGQMTNDQYVDPVGQASRAGFVDTMTDMKKQAGVLDGLKHFSDGILDDVAHAVVKAMDHPSTVLTPKLLGLTAAGIATSVYAPRWAGGPGAEDDKFSAKRMARNTILYNVVGGSVLGAPSSAKGLVRSIKNRKPINAVAYGTGLVPVVGIGMAANSELRKDDPSGRELLKGYALGAGTRKAIGIGLTAYTYYPRFRDSMRGNL